MDMPLVEIEGKRWFLLKNISDSWIVRAVDIEKPRQVRERSDHRSMESRAEGSVKCRPTKEWDLLNR